MDRRNLTASWAYLREQGRDVPEDEDGNPILPGRMPSYDDEEPGLEFFRALLQEEDLSGLTMCRTYFGLSAFEHVSFANTDVHESRMCWNDWTDCDFTDADLTSCDLRACTFIRCRFVGAVMANGDLRWSTFEECDFAQARMEGIRLTRERGAKLDLSTSQRAEIHWQADEGPEPPGG